MKKIKFVKLAILLAAATVSLAACGEKATDTKEIIVGASVEPHATILKSEEVTKSLEEAGYTLKVIEYTDYVQPNVATSDGSLDANFFQHVPYLEEYNASSNTTLVSVQTIHFEPLGLYAGKTKTLEELKDGAQIAIPNDVTNEARALLLLEKAGLIVLNPGVGLNATPKDILENPKNIEFVEVEAAQTVRTLQDVDYAVVNGNYALTEGLSASEDALLVEDSLSEAALKYANVLVVNSGKESDAKTVALVKALTSSETKAFIDEKWQGAVVPVFK